MGVLEEARWYVGKAYSGVRSRLERRSLASAAPAAIAEAAAQLTFDDDPVRFLMGPTNTAGQAREWTRVANDLPGVSARSVHAAATSNTFRYTTDVTLPASVDAGDITPWRETVLEQTTHVIFESCRPLLGQFASGTLEADLPAFAEAGIGVGALMHGSDVRSGQLHASQVTHSPFHTATGPYWRALEKTAARNRDILSRFPGPVFASTPGLVSHIPGSTWLPLVVDIDRFTNNEPVLERDVPVVIHAPSNPRFKGTQFIEPVLRKLCDEGLISYQPISGIPHDEMPDFIGKADIMIDQLTMGNTGVQHIEAMAAGRLTVSNLSTTTRDTIGQDIPYVQADPDTFEDVMRDILANRDAYIDIARSGPSYARDNHDGTRSQAVLARTLGW